MKSGERIGNSLSYTYQMLTTPNSAEATQWKFKYNDSGMGLYIADASDDSFVIGMSNLKIYTMEVSDLDSNVSKYIGLLLYEKVPNTDAAVTVSTASSTQIMKEKQTYMSLPCAVGGGDPITIKISPINKFMQVRIGDDAYAELGATVSKDFTMSGAASKTITYTVRTIDGYAETKSLELNTTSHVYDANDEKCRQETVYTDGDCTKGRELRIHCINEEANGCTSY